MASSGKAREPGVGGREDESGKHQVEIYDNVGMSDKTRMANDGGTVWDTGPRGSSDNILPSRGQGQDSRFADTCKKPDDESEPEISIVVDDSRTDETGHVVDDSKTDETGHVVDDSRTDKDGRNEVHAKKVAERPVPSPRKKKSKPIVQDTVTDVMGEDPRIMDTKACTTVTYDTETGQIHSVIKDSARADMPQTQQTGAGQAEAQCDESAAGTEAELSMSTCSSVEIIPESEGNEESTFVDTNCPLIRLPYGSMIPKCHSISDSASTTDKIKENENNSNTIPKYSLENNRNKSLLHVIGREFPISIPQLDGKLNVSVEKQYILIDGEYAYRIVEDENITLEELKDYTRKQDGESSQNIATQASASAADNQSKEGRLTEKEIVVGATQKVESTKLTATTERDKMQEHKNNGTIATALATANQTEVDKINNETVVGGSQQVDVELEAKMSGQDKRYHTEAKGNVTLFPTDRKDPCIIDSDDSSSSNTGSHNDTDSESGKNSVTAEGKQEIDQLTAALQSLTIKTTIQARGWDDHTLSNETSRRPGRRETEVSARGITEMPVVPPRRETETSAKGISKIPVVPSRRETETSAEGISEIPVVPARRETETSAEGISEIPGVHPRQGKTKEEARGQKLVDDKPESHTLSSPLSKGRRSRKHDIPVRVYHGKQNKLHSAYPPNIESYMKWKFLLHNQETANQVALGLKVENDCIVLQMDENVTECAVAKIMEMALDSIKHLYFGQFKLNNDAPEIAEVSSEFAKQKLLYAEYIQEDKIYVFVCHSEMQERAKQEYANALKLITTDNHEIATTNFQCPMGFDLVCDCYNVQTLISSKFPSVQIQCVTNYSKRECECSLSGRDVAILEEVKGFLQAEVVNKYPCNSIAFSDIRHIDNMDAGSIGMFLKTELKFIILEKGCPDEIHFQINNEAKRIVVVGTSQIYVDHVCSRVKLSIAYKEFKLDTSDEEMKKNISDIESEHTGRIFTSVDGNKCHCVGSTEIVKKLENRLRPQTSSVEKRRNRNESQDLSFKPYLLKKDQKTRTIEVTSTNMFKLIKKRICVGEGIKITPFEKNGKCGFIIVGHDDDLIIATENEIQSLQEEMKEEQTTVRISDEQRAHYETLKSMTEQQCNVIINTLKQNKTKKEDLTHETKSVGKEWILKGGQTLRISYGQAQDCWKDLLIELKCQPSGSECHSIVEKSGNKKTTQLLVTQWTDEYCGKWKHNVQEATTAILLQAKAYECTHVCMSLDERFGSSIRQLTKQILKSVVLYLDDVKIPVVFELCLKDFEEFTACHKVIAETMTSGDSANDSDEGQSLEKGTPGNQQRLKHINVTVIKGQLNNVKADVLVNTTASNLDLKSGAVSLSLLTKAGDDMQKECKRKYVNGIKEGQVALTKGYKLSCKHVLHGALPTYNKQNLQTLETFVMDCLEKTRSLGHRSIAFPAIGTGNLEYPADNVAEVMFNCVRMFDEKLNSPKQVKNVMFVVYEKDLKVVNAFEKRKGIFEKGDSIIPSKPELPTSRQIRCSSITLNAHIGSIQTCGSAEALLYFWDSTSLHSVSAKHPFLQQLGKDGYTDFFKKRAGQSSVFSTEGGKLRNHRIVHIPAKNSSDALMQGFRDGVRKAEIEQYFSAAVYFDKSSPFVVHQDKLAKELIEAVNDYGAHFKYLRHVTLVVDGMHNSGKIFQAFENYHETVEEASETKTSILMQVNITGFDRDIKKAKHMLKEWSRSSKILDSNDLTDANVSGACAAVDAPGPQSIDRTASPVMVSPEQFKVVHSPPDIKPFLSNMDCLQGYVQVSNVPDWSYDTLGGKLLSSRLPVGFKSLIYLKGTGKAMLICNTSEDANKLSGYNGAAPFGFRCIERQVFGRFRLCIEKKDVERMKQQREFEYFMKGLNQLNATTKHNVDLEIQVETSYQMSCVGELKTMCMSESAGSHCTVASKTDDFEHVVTSKVSIDDVSLKVWEVMQIEKQEAIQKFKDTCGSITYADNILTITRKENTSVEGSFDDYVVVFQSFVTQLKTMEFEDVPIDRKFVQDICAWTEEIEKIMNIKCCTFSSDPRKVIVYCDAYQNVCKVKHYFLVKQNKIKTTGRRRIATQDTGESGQSLQPEYTMNTDKQSTDIILQRPNFEWERDATNIKTFKTSEGIQVYVYEANILNLPVDCIVNAANDTLNHGGGVAEVIAKNAGRELVNEGDAYINQHGKIAVGHAMSTTAGKLAYKHVIHAVGPRWSDYFPHSGRDVSKCEHDLSNAICNSILEANKLKLKNIALPAISSAIFGVPEDLCVCLYVEATLKYSKDHATRHSITDIHFIDKNHNIISLLQDEFRIVLNEGGISPYHSKSNSGRQRQRHCQRNFSASSDLSTIEIPKNVPAASHGKIAPTHEHSSEKDIFSFCGCTDKRLLVYKGDVLGYKNSAVVVTIDENLNGGSIANSVCKQIPVQIQNAYQSKLKDQLPAPRPVGQVAITKGFGSPFDSIIHVVFPTSTRRKDHTQRRNCLGTTYRSIFNDTAKKTHAEVITTTLIGIDENNIKDVDMCAEAFLQGYISFVEETLLQRTAPFDVHLVCRDAKNAERICSSFRKYVTTQQEHVHLKSKESSVRPARDATESQHESLKSMSMVGVDDEDGDCVICMDSMKMPKQLKCGHKYCTECIDKHFQFKKACPTCGAVCGVITGDQPRGYIDVRSTDCSCCSGYADCGQIVIQYSFPDGRQQENHPNPGNRYRGISRTAYLPNNREGRQIRDMLKVAFDRKLVFTIGSSRTTGQEGVITWNDIHHKTDPRPNTQFGYPDETYLSRVKLELADKGVTVEDIPK